MSSTRSVGKPLLPWMARIAPSNVSTPAAIPAAPAFVRRRSSSASVCSGVAGTAQVYVASVEIRDVMTEGVVSAAPTATVRQVAELMRERNVGSVVLVDEGGAITGFVTDRDLALGALTDGRDPGDPVEAHASSPVVTAAPAMEVEEAAELMVRHGVRRLPMLDEGRLTGIITLDDLAVRTGDLELAQHMTAQITRAALPGFYFHDRGG